MWNMIDSSFITTLPDTWGIKQKFILLAVNHWDNEYQRVNLGGLTCDSDDYYIMESVKSRVFLPKPDPGEPLYIGFSTPEPTRSHWAVTAAFSTV
jgi:arginine decarboxylase